MKKKNEKSFLSRFFLTFPASLAVTRAPDALSVTRTVRYAAIALRDVTFRSFPALFAMTESAAILTVAGAKNGTNAWNKNL